MSTTFTKKHYEMIAETLSHINKKHSELDSKTELDYHQLVVELCQLFASDNERFDSTKFIKACHMPAYKASRKYTRY